MYSTSKFLFLYSSRNRFTKEWENIFADSQNSGLSLEVCWHLSPKLGKNTTILGKNLLNRTKLPPGQGPQIRSDISPPAFRFCSDSNFKIWRNWFFCQRFQEFSLFSPHLKRKYILYIACSSWKILCSNHLFGCLLILYFVGHLMSWYLDPLCMYQPHLFNSHNLLSNGSSVMKTFWKTSEYF